MNVQAFGEWDAPATDGAEWIEVPTHLTCMHCRQNFEEGESGLIQPNGYATHRECSLRSVLGGIGHIVDHEKYCRGQGDPDAGFTYRQSAVLVWWDHMGMPVTERMLDSLREGKKSVERDSKPKPVHKQTIEEFKSRMDETHGPE